MFLDIFMAVVIYFPYRCAYTLCEIDLILNLIVKGFDKIYEAIVIDPS